VRLALAPAYARQAIERHPAQVVDLLTLSIDLPSETHATTAAGSASVLAQAFASYDWNLHHTLTILSGNAIFTLIINGFCDLYLPMAQRYFASASARSASRAFYTSLLAAASRRNPDEAEQVTRSVMQASLEYWLSSDQ